MPLATRSPARRACVAIALALAAVAAIATVAAGCGSSATTAPSSEAPPSQVASAAPSPTDAGPRPSGSGTSGLTEAHVLVPGTHVFMIPPDGYGLTTAFTGFDADGGGSILVSELPAGVGDLAPGLTIAAFAGQGVELLETTDERFGDHAGILFRGLQPAGGTTFRKWIVLVGSEAESALVTASIPESDPAVDTIRDAMLSILFDPDLVVDPFEGLDYAIDPASPLVLAGRIVNGLTFNTSGEIPSADPLEPSFTIAPSIGSVDVDDREAFARARLEDLPLITDVAIDSVTEVEIDGLPGLELVASAHHDSGTPVTVVMTVAFTDDGYVLMVGRSRETAADDLLPAFRTMAASYRGLDR